jgi:GNAT superfamily N-acetyltransferase
MTYVAVADGAIVGFATVTAGSLERSRVPHAQLRRRLPGYPLPILRLARLGVDLRAQGLGIGVALLRHVLQLATAQRDLVGSAGVVADAKPDAVAFYERFGFSPLEGVREGLVAGEPLPMFLGVETVVAAG